MKGGRYRRGDRRLAGTGSVAICEDFSILRLIYSAEMLLRFFGVRTIAVLLIFSLRGLPFIAIRCPLVAQMAGIAGVF